MRLKQAGGSGAAIPLVPMIDVLMIMLIFFLVTSTYLNLRMIPMAQSTGEPEVAATPETASGGVSETLLIRLDPDGNVLLRGQPIDRAALAAMLQERLATTPNLNVILLPSGRASTQDLVSLLDTATNAGVSRLRIVRLAEAP